ncbi:MAG: bifunctional glutamate N-acetyltransferase/amino-acid acetyltransferase ArgJ [Deltaproteobacteria bacterium]|nr:bifunctional glutamate N-acetyltransferase/amino-acid acetyltransferase ArgJ [Deltaproteobacteria bacterium]
MSENETKIASGYRFAGVHCGLKADGVADLALIVSEAPAVMAATFTRNRFPAAPVVYGRRQLELHTPVRAVLVNAGNANACTGRQGEIDVMTTVEVLASVLKIDRDEIFVSSTGVIGEPFPVTTVLKGIEALAEGIAADTSASSGALEAAARAIMTTDQVPKIAASTVMTSQGPVTVTGIAKGAGMIHPDMATMLAYLLCDVEIGEKEWREMLSRVVDLSFNRISVDGDTSTNDTVLALANGASGCRLESESELAALETGLLEVARQLAYMIVKDGEGATKVVTVRVVGAADRPAAEKVARAVANSALVKTAFFGQDANWGRIVAAVGYAGVEIDSDRVNIDFDQVRVVSNGVRDPRYRESDGAAVLKEAEFVVKIDLNQGDGDFSLLTSDLTHDYISINADYRS